MVDTVDMVGTAGTADMVDMADTTAAMEDTVVTERAMAATADTAMVDMGATVGTDINSIDINNQYLACDNNVNNNSKSAFYIMSLIGDDIVILKLLILDCLKV